MKKALFILTFLLSGAAFAHDDATMAAMKAPNGGQLKMAGWYHFELVSKGSDVIIYITDHANVAKPSKDVKGKLTILDGGKKQDITLTPAAPNLLKGKLNGKLGQKAKVLASITFADGRTEQARYEMGASANASADHSNHH
ncbi:hypothetical protein ABHF33_02695 [Chitinibacter sp. FCG-7]|uniref:Copper chaperone PCu(A)C n=1 Tax=Chitinibacter mangrovi TaxID=3153927 RepID=A0AAU7FC22_9NEIS